MERSTKHRILGILVVVALVIISLPLFQGGKEANTQTASISTPPFPDQSVQVAPPIQTTTPVPTVAANVGTMEQKPAPTTTTVESPEDQPDDIITTLHPSVVNAQEPAKPVAAEPAAATATSSVTAPANTPVVADQPQVATSNVIPVIKPATAVAPKAAMKTNHAKALQAANTKFKKLGTTRVAQAKRATKFKSLAPTMQTALKDDGLVSLRNASYVIQIGSFKNKTNALKLVNALRANGYPAFIQKMSTSVGENTRVFVGPSNRRNAAVAMADKLENHMHLKGIIISYQPLTL